MGRGDRSKPGRLAQRSSKAWLHRPAEPICRTLSGGWSGSRTVHVSGRPGWWSRALCRSRARGKSKWAGGRGMGGRTGGPEDGSSRPQAPGRPPGLFKRRPPSPPTDGSSSGWEQVAERPARSQAAGRKAEGTTMALPPMERVRPRTELHRRGTAARKPSPSNGWAGVELGCASWRTRGRLLTAAGSRTDTPALQDGGSDCEEAERREDGSSSAERPARS